MLGVRDLVSHLLHLAQKEGVEENTLIKSSFSKLVFIALAYCYRYGINIKYDILFRKSPYGASSDDVNLLLGERYSSKVNYENAQEAKQLSDNEKFDKMIVAMIRMEVEQPLSFAPYIVNSEVFQTTNYAEERRKSRKLASYSLLQRETDNLWTLYEILLYAGLNNEEINSGKFNLRLPLGENDYAVVKKYIELHDETMNNNENASRKFTLDEIEKMRRIPETTLDSVRAHGAKKVSDD